MEAKISDESGYSGHLRLRRVSLSTAAVLGALLFPAGASAGTLDQSQTTSSIFGAGFGGQVHNAQTFTAGLTGPLDQVDVLVRERCAPNSGSGISVAIHTASGEPDPTVIASATLSPAAVPEAALGWVPVTFATPPSVAAGTTYALVLSAPDAPNCGDGGGGGTGATTPPYEWGSTSGDPYVRGTPWYSSDSGTSWSGESGDRAFKTYVVSAAPPPGGNPPPPDGTTPPPNGSTPPPAPSEFTRTLSIAYSEKKDKFNGRLASQSPACISGQKVKVFEKEKGKDPKLGADASLANGKYSLKEKNAEGKFYAKVTQTNVADGTCLAAQSETIKVG